MTALFLLRGDELVYVDITIDLKHYDGSVFDLRLSDYHSVKKVVDILLICKLAADLASDVLVSAFKSVSSLMKLFRNVA